MPAAAGIGDDRLARAIDAWVAALIVWVCAEIAALLEPLVSTGS